MPPGPPAPRPRAGELAGSVIRSIGLAIVGAVAGAVVWSYPVGVSPVAGSEQVAAPGQPPVAGGPDQGVRPAGEPVTADLSPPTPPGPGSPGRAGGGPERSRSDPIIDATRSGAAAAAGLAAIAPSTLDASVSQRLFVVVPDRVAPPTTSVPSTPPATEPSTTSTPPSTDSSFGDRREQRRGEVRQEGLSAGAEEAVGSVPGALPRTGADLLTWRLGVIGFVLVDGGLLAVWLGRLARLTARRRSQPPTPG